MNFEDLVNKVDAVHQDTFAIDATIDNQPVRGIFEEDFDEFEGADTVSATFDIPMNELPKSTKVKSILNLVDSGRVFRVTKPIQRDKVMTLVLSEIRS